MSLETIKPIFFTKESLKKERVQIWFQLIQKEGVRHFFFPDKNITQLTIFFNGQSTYISESSLSVIRVTTWYKYRDGECKPNANTIDQVKTKIDKAEYWLYLPFWEVLENKLSIKKIEELLFSSSKKYRLNFFKKNKETGGWLRKPKSIKRIKRYFKVLTIDGTFESLSVMTLIIAELEITLKKDELFNHMSFFYHSLLRTIRNICLETRMSQFYEFLTHAIRQRFLFNWLNLLNGSYEYEYLRDEEFPSKVASNSRIANLLEVGQLLQNNYLSQDIVQNHINNKLLLSNGRSFINKRRNVNAFLYRVDSLGFHELEGVMRGFQVSSLEHDKQGAYMILDALVAEHFKLDLPDGTFVGRLLSQKKIN